MINQGVTLPFFLLGLAYCAGNSGVEEIHRDGTVGALKEDPQAPWNRKICRSLISVQEM